MFEIINARWTDQFHRPLHAKGHILNLELFYKAQENGTIHQDAWIGSSYHACVEKMHPEIITQNLVVTELTRYKNVDGLFSRGQAQKSQRHKVTG